MKRLKEWFIKNDKKITLLIFYAFAVFYVIMIVVYLIPILGFFVNKLFS